MNLEGNDFEEQIHGYIQSLDRKEITKVSYLKILLSFNEYLKANSILSPNKKDILCYKEYLSKRVKSASIQKTIVVLRGFFTYLDSEDVYRNIMTGIRGVKIEPTFKRASLTLLEMGNLLDKANELSESIEGMRNYAIIALLATTGLRTIEVERADVSDLVAISDEYKLYIQGKGHDDKDLYVKISDDVYQIIMKYLFLREDEFESLFITHGRNNHGERIKTRTVRGIVKEVLRRTGIDDKRYTAHSLRHSLATNLILYGNGTLEEAKQILRHKDISTTQIYNHSLARSQNDGELKMSKLLFERKEKEHE
jgi:site-specific recombinase XerD